MSAEISRILNAYRLWRRSGLDGVQEKLRWKQAVRQERKAAKSRYEDYRNWVAMYDTLTDVDRQAIKARISQLSYQPLISVIVPVYNVNERWLRLAIESVRRQLYSRWELCIADDKSDRTQVRKVLEEYSKRDNRIRVAFRDTRGHIATASNTALEMASGEFIALLDHDDELSEHALYMIVEELNDYPGADLIYSDEDRLARNDERIKPHFKPDWSPDLLHSYNCISHLGVYRTAIVRQLGGFREGYEGSQDYDLALRVVEQIPENHIRHVPHILYHWREVGDSASAKKYAKETAAKAIRSHFQRRGINATVTAGYAFANRVIYELPSPPPLVSLIVVARDRVDQLRRITRNLLNDTDYGAVELIVVDNQSSEPETIAFFEQLLQDARVKIVPYNGAFNLSAIRNLAARTAKGDLLGFVNLEIKVGSSQWLTEMVRHAVRPEIGAVGPKLCSENHLVEHAGFIAGLNGLIGQPHRNVPKRWSGYFLRSNVVQNYSAVTGKCLLIRRSVFLEIGGFNEVELPAKFNDIDLCLRLQENGYKILWTPYAELYCSEAAAAGDDSPQTNEREFIKSRWANRLLNDPYYSQNLTLDTEDFSLAKPPRILYPWKNA